MNVKDKLVQEIGLALGRDSGVPPEWEEITAVVRLGSGTLGGWSKAVLASGDTQNFYTEDGYFEKHVERLHDIMINDEGKSWVACKVTLIRKTRDINIKFEWDDPHIWDTPLPF